MRLDHTRRVLFPRLEISFSQDAEWKALISKYIGIIPLSGDGCSAAEQSMSGGPPPRTAVSSAMTAKVGAAASDSQSAPPRAARLARAALDPGADLLAGHAHRPQHEASAAGAGSYRSWWRTHSMVKRSPSSSRPFGVRSSSL